MRPHPEVVKAYKKKLDADHKASDYNYGANKARATKAEKHLFAKINKHHPDLSQQDKIKLHTELGKMNEDSRGFQPAMMLHGPTKKKIIANRKKKSKTKEEGNGLWANIWAKRRRGERMRKPGEKGAPTQAALDRARGEAKEDTTTAAIPNPAQTAMGPRFKTNLVHDRRKKKGFPKLLKRFRDYYQEKGID